MKSKQIQNHRRNPYRKHALNQPRIHIPVPNDLLRHPRPWKQSRSCQPPKKQKQNQPRHGIEQKNDKLAPQPVNSPLIAFSISSDKAISVIANPTPAAKFPDRTSAITS